MSCYISSNENRFYAGSESSYGETPTIGSSNRLPAVKLSIKHAIEKVDRRDKTGGRTFSGLPTGLRRKTEYQLRTYLTAWNDATDQPGYGPLFRAAMGSVPLLHSGSTIADGSSNLQLRFTGSHGLTAGQAVSVGGELRFVSAVESDTAVELNAPLLHEHPTEAFDRIKTVTAEIASKFALHGFLLVCVDDAGIHTGGGKFIQARAQVGRTLGLKQIVKDAHF